ncbi:MAG: peptidoglycan recognition family protein [Planctomycetota bacterium]
MRGLLFLGVAAICVGSTGCMSSEGSHDPESARGDTSSVARPAVVSAEAWGSTPQPLGDDRRHVPRYVTIHHAGVTWADGDAAKKVKALQTWGQNEKGWPDLPYHFLIAPNGTVFEGRPMAYEPETNTSYDVHGHLGVQLYGNFEEQRVSTAQMTALVNLTAWLLDKHGFTIDAIGGHRDRLGADTSCPGRDLARYLDDGSFAAWVEATRRGEEPAIELGPPLPDGPTEMIPYPGARQ